MSDALVKSMKNGIYEILQYAQEHAISVNVTCFCPYVRCLNQIHQGLDIMCDHIFIFSILRSYTILTRYGEVLHKLKTSRGIIYVHEWMSDHLEDMVRDVSEENFGRAYLYDSLNSDSKEELYLEYTNFTRLSATLTLFSLKARNGWTNKSFIELLELLKHMLP